MIKLTEVSLIWLLQVVVHRTHLLLDHVGALPVSEELIACTWEEQKHTIVRPELSWLC